MLLSLIKQILESSMLYIEISFINLILFRNPLRFEIIFILHFQFIKQMFPGIIVSNILSSMFISTDRPNMVRRHQKSEKALQNLYIYMLFYSKNFKKCLQIVQFELFQSQTHQQNHFFLNQSTHLTHLSKSLILNQSFYAFLHILSHYKLRNPNPHLNNIVIQTKQSRSIIPFRLTSEQREQSLQLFLRN